MLHAHTERCPKRRSMPPLWKLRHLLMQTIMVTIWHKLVWVQIQVDERERQRTLSEVV